MLRIGIACFIAFNLIGALFYAALLAGSFWFMQGHIDPVEKADYLSGLLSNDTLWLLCFGLGAVISAAVYGAKVSPHSRYISTILYAAIVGLRMAFAVAGGLAHAAFVFMVIALLCFLASGMAWSMKERAAWPQKLRDAA